MDWKLLREVSRSFYMTLRWMPGEVRDTVALGYLLARASDTVADTTDAPVARRLEALQELRRFDIATRRLAELTLRQPTGAEARLVAAIPELLESLERSPDRSALEWVWDQILQGQIFDLVRFGDGSPPLSPEELDEYTYSVAGSVGEFWTRLCAKRISGFSGEPLDAMVELGVSYGKGLQLVNVLRDRDADAVAGRVYAERSRFEALAAQARSGLEAGLHWAARVDHGRVRFACVAPARIGLATLDRLSPDSGPAKVSRAEQRRILAGSIPALWRGGLPKITAGDQAASGGKSSSSEAT